MDDSKDWSKFVYSYRFNLPGADIQKVVSSHPEFRELSPTLDEPTPLRAEYFSYQEFIARYLSYNDELILWWEPGVGKTGAIIATAERFRAALRTNPIDGFLLGSRTHIKRCNFITKNQTLVEKFRSDFTNKHTFGTPFPDDFYVTSTHRVIYEHNKEKSDAELKELFSYSINVLDEAHLLIERSATEAELKELKEDDLRIYYWFQRVLALAEHSITLIVTGTIRTTEPGESSRIYHLLPSSKNHPLPEKTEELLALIKNDPGYIKKALNGKVSHLKQTEKYTRKVYRGERLSDLVDVESDLIVYPVEMSNDQSKEYLQAAFNIVTREGERVNSFRGEEKKAINIASKDGISSITSKADLAKWAAKFDRAIKLTEEADGCVFIYTTKVDHGSRDLAEAFNRIYKYGRLESSDAPPNEKRIAILLSEMTSKKNDEILNAFNGPENVQGSLAKAMISSPIGEVGIDVNHTVRIIKIDDTWTPGRSEQAESRPLRPASQRLLFEMRGGNKKIDVEIYNLVAIFPDSYVDTIYKRIKGLQSSEDEEYLRYVQIFKLADIPDKEWKRRIKYSTIDIDSYIANAARRADAEPVLKIWEQNAIDYQLNALRNGQPRRRDLDPPQLEIEDGSYNAIYNKPMIDQITNQVTALVGSQFAVNAEEIDVDKFFLHRAIKKIPYGQYQGKIGERYSINWDRGLLYAAPDRSANYDQAIYTQFHFINRIPLAAAISQILDNSDNGNWTEQEWIDRFEQQKINSRIQVIEDLLSKGVEDFRYAYIIKRYGGKSIFILPNKPIGSINYAQRILNGIEVDDSGLPTGGKKKGRPRKPTNRQTICDFHGNEDEVQVGEKVVLHILDTLSKVSNYNITTNYVGAVSIKVLVNRQFIKAEVGTPEEIVYRQFITQAISERVDDYLHRLGPERNQVYAHVILAEDPQQSNIRTVRIVNNRLKKLEPQERDCQIYLGSDKFLSRGLVVKSTKPINSVDMVTYLEVPLPKTATEIELLLPENQPKDILEEVDYPIERLRSSLQELGYLPPLKATQKQLVRILYLDKLGIITPATTFKTDWMKTAIREYILEFDPTYQSIVDDPYYSTDERILLLLQAILLIREKVDLEKNEFTREEKATNKTEPITTYRRVFADSYYRDPETIIERIARFFTWDNNVSQSHHIPQLLIDYLRDTAPGILEL